MIVYCNTQTCTVVCPHYETAILTQHFAADTGGFQWCEVRERQRRSHARTRSDSIRGACLPDAASIAGVTAAIDGESHAPRCGASKKRTQTAPHDDDAIVQPV